MKKRLFVVASFFVLDVLLMSPLHAMKREHETETLTVSKNKIIPVVEEAGIADVSFYIREDIWGKIATALKDNDQDSFRWTSKSFYKCSESALASQNREGRHYQCIEFKLLEKILTKFNVLVIQYICSNLTHLSAHSLSGELEEYTKNYGRLEKFPGLPEKSFFKYFLSAQHLHLWKEKLAAEELTLLRRPGETLVSTQIEYRNKLKDVNVALPVLEVELNNKKNALFQKNPFPLNLNEVGLCYLSYLSKKLADPERSEPEKKSITFEFYLKELGHTLPPEQKKCSMIKIFADFEPLNELNGINGARDDTSEDTGDSESINECSIDFKGFEDIKFHTLGLQG